MKQSNQKKASQKNNRVFSKIKDFLLLLLIFLLPTQFGKHFFFDFSYVLGVRVDYLAPTIYLTDIIVIALIILCANIIVKAVRNKTFLVICALFGINILFSQSPPISTYASIRMIELYFVYVIVQNSTVPWRQILIAFLAGAISEFALGMYHLIVKRSLQSVAYFFGERYFTLSTPGIAKSSLQGIEFLRPYGTFPHPNSLGGFYLLLYTFVLTFQKFRPYPIFKAALLLASSFLIFLSFSKNATLGFFLVSLIYLILERNTIGCKWCTVGRGLVLAIICGIFLFFQSDPASLEKRFILVKNAIYTITNHPLFGVGNGAYVVSQGDFSSSFVNFLNQPVHSIYLLYVAQMGLVIGLCILLLLFPFFRSIIRRCPLIIFVVLLTGLSDHYWLTLHQNMFLVAFILGSIDRKL